MKTFDLKLYLLLGFFLFSFSQCTVFQSLNELTRNDGDENAEMYLNQTIHRYLPEGNPTQVFAHQYFSFSYDAAHRQSEWVAYELTPERLKAKPFKKRSKYNDDGAIFRNPSTSDDYKKSGYDRGQLVPYEDMAFSNNAVEDAYLMSNVSPQDPGFNRGAWMRLERQVRSWTLEAKELLVVAGPILKPEAGNKFNKIGNDVSVPHDYYKIVVDIQADVPRAIGFIFKNESTSLDLTHFVVTIDEIERRTGINFFPQLADSLENVLEATTSRAAWGLQEVEMEVEALANFLPSNNTGQVVSHTNYTLSYFEKYEQAEWVAYELTADRLRNNSVKRKNRFTSDPAVMTKSAHKDDYKRSGYDRGHLAPCADMLINKTVMLESFYMSNMSPQHPKFNRGIWKALEAQVRVWAMESEHLYVITGPVLVENDGPFPVIGNNVAVPTYYYKVLLDLRKPEVKAIAFILKNEGSDLPLSAFAVSIDEVESMTNLDFFPDLPDAMETKLESTLDLSAWGLAPKKSKNIAANADE